MDKREQIITSAIELFAHSGFDNTSIRDLSAKAGVNVAMINYYFGSKEKLFVETIEHKSNYLKEVLEQLQANTQMNEMEKINSIIETYVNRILSNPLYHRILSQEMLLKARPTVSATIEKIFTRNSAIIKSILEEGMRKKLFRKVDPELTIASLLGTINHIMLTPAINSLVANHHGSNDPVKDETVSKRIISHLQKLMEAHLLNH